MDSREISFAVVGIDYPNDDKSNRRFEIALLRPGEAVELRREPNNPADENAVGVFSCRDVRIGYLTSERASWVSRKIAAGEDVVAIFQRLSPVAAWVRVRFDGRTPTLPDLRAEEDDRDDWFDPDPDGPEWGA